MCIVEMCEGDVGPLKHMAKLKSIPDSRRLGNVCVCVRALIAHQQ